MALSSFKRYATLAVLGATAFSLTACGEAPEANTGAQAPGAADFTACMVSDEGGFDDKSFNELSHAGLQKAGQELGIKVQSTESQSPDEYDANLSTMVDQGCNIIIPVGFKLADATQTAALENPDVNFAIVDYAGIESPNVLHLNYDTAQAAFLAGYAAAAYSKSGMVGTFGGDNIPTVTIFMDGFVKGVEHFNKAKGKDVKVLGWGPDNPGGEFVGNFTDTVKAQQITEGFLSQGADVVMPVGGPLYKGAASAIQGAGGSAALIGVDSDLAEQDPALAGIVLTSVEKGLDVSVYEAIKLAVNGEFAGGTYVGTLQNEGVGLSDFGDFEAKLPQGTVQELEQLEADIVAGKFPNLSDASPSES